MKMEIYADYKESERNDPPATLSGTLRSRFNKVDVMWPRRTRCLEGRLHSSSLFHTCSVWLGVNQKTLRCWSQYKTSGTQCAADSRPETYWKRWSCFSRDESRCDTTFQVQQASVSVDIIEKMVLFVLHVCL